MAFRVRVEGTKPTKKTRTNFYLAEKSRLDSNIKSLSSQACEVTSTPDVLEGS